MKSPIMIYYQIDDFRENHRFYMDNKSDKQLIYMDNKSDKQLKGEEVSKSDLEKSGECENSLYIGDFREYGMSTISASLDVDDIAFPCGLKAKSYFQDEIDEFKIFEKEVELTTENIAYKKDIDTFTKKILILFLKSNLIKINIGLI